LAYSIISPIINGLAVLAFFLFYQLYKYLFLYVLQQDLRLDTGGLFFPKAIQHVFTGLYLQQICLVALFFLARDADNKASSIPQAALTIVLIVFTAGFHIILNNSFGPLIVALPLSLKDRVGKGVSVEENNDDVDKVPEGAAKQQEIEAESKAAGKARRSEDIETGITEEPRTSSSDQEHQGSRSNDTITKEEKKIADAKENAEASEVEKYGFAHPAASRPQRTIWIPKFVPVVKKAKGEPQLEEDPFLAELKGIAKRLIADDREAGVDSSLKGAKIDGKGKIYISGAPPGYSGL